MRKVLFFFILWLTCVPSHSEDLTAGVAQMPIYAESATKGVLIDFVKALSEESGAPIKIMILPFSRSLQFVKNHRVDFHLPLIEAPYASGRALDFDFSTETLFHVNFVLYDNKNNPVDINALNELNIETDHAHKEYFDFDIRPSACMECSIKKLNTGRIDGLIYSDMAIDPLIKRYDLGNIQRRLYKRFNVKIILPKGARGGELDLMLTQTINTLRRNGKLKQVMEAVDQPYVNWQP